MDIKKNKVFTCDHAKICTIKNIFIAFEKMVKKFIEKNGVNNAYGARPLRIAIQNIVEDTISENLIEGKIKENSKIIVKSLDGKPIVETT